MFQRPSSSEPAQELATTIESLALKVGVKTKELDDLTAKYTQRLNFVNELITNIREQLHLPESKDQDNGEIDIDDLIQYYEKRDDKEFLIVPLNKLAYKEEIIHKINKDTTTDIPTDSGTSNDVQSNNIPKNFKKKSKKKTCSYCFNNGHNRAICPIRLGNEKN
ncbi:hypothetical protein PACTADRAFT_34758 [Pachysolen tannophilus NRRL Y-2460]|uniref:Uncharacterized protein n=1 Tax=Pachysolen tannophilus NRRL Y-2460 TaxID=669874 RepID=A0A1E4TTA0_PACTA|nr:hypothetical protein PACTADRAFT_34758 [Pachysolen tannophilus NRRL Y-2460]